MGLRCQQLGFGKGALHPALKGVDCMLSWVENMGPNKVRYCTMHVWAMDKEKETGTVIAYSCNKVIYGPRGGFVERYGTLVNFWLLTKGRMLPA